MGAIEEVADAGCPNRAILRAIASRQAPESKSRMPMLVGVCAGETSNGVPYPIGSCDNVPLRAPYCMCWPPLIAIGAAQTPPPPA